MQTLEFIACGPTGAALPAASVAVYLTGGTTLATLYDVNGALTINPLRSSVAGQVAFQAPNGTYDVQITSADGSYSAPLLKQLQLVDMVALAGEVTAIGAALVTGGLVYATQSALLGNTTAPVNTPAYVSSDSTVANNGLYFKNSGSGWTGPVLLITSTVHLAALGTDVTACLTGSGAGPQVQVLNGAETGYVFGVFDAANHLSLGLDKMGALHVFSWAPGTVPGSALAAGSVGTAALASAAVSYAKLDTTITPYVAAPLVGAEAGYVFAVEDAAGHLSIGIDTAGAVHIPTWAQGTIPGAALAASSVSQGKLDTTVTSLLGVGISASETGYLFVIVDASAHILFGIKQDGTFVGTISSLANGSVTEVALNSFLDRMAVPHVGDVVEVMPDLWRGDQGQVATWTSTAGDLWTPFPEVLTRNLRGLNLSGTSLDFRHTAGLPIRGKRYAGQWNPLATTTQASITYVAECYTFSGSISLSSTAAMALPAASSAGRYYRYASPTTLSYAGQTLIIGDLVVDTGSAYVVQKGPAYTANTAPLGGRLEYDWFAVTAAGTYAGVAYASGDRIVYMGYDSFSGNGDALWYHGQPLNGELFYYGSFTPGSFSSPNTAAQGDLWQASSAGTDTGGTGLTLAASDYALYDGGVWGEIPGDTITTVASGKMIPALRCSRTAAEWEVRRTDKGATIVSATASCRRQVSPRRSSDTILLLSDSMFAVPNVQAQLAALVAPRTVNLLARGGGSSRNVLSSYEAYIANLSDPYRGEMTFAWHGQNNQPAVVGDVNWGQVLETTDRLRDLLGSRDRRYCVLAVLGQDNMTYNSGLGRIVCSQWETGFGSGGVLAALEAEYAAILPSQWLSPRNILMAAAGSLQDVRVPAASVGGAQLTEAQTAAAYGWAPISMFLPYGGLTVLPVGIASLTLKGYFNSNGLPTGGSPNDCYTRSGGTSTLTGTNSIGNLLVNVAGTWGEYAFDITHLNPSTAPGGTPGGGSVLAAALSSYLASAMI